MSHPKDYRSYDQEWFKLAEAFQQGYFTEVQWNCRRCTAEKQRAEFNNFKKALRVAADTPTKMLRHGQVAILTDSIAMGYIAALGQTKFYITPPRKKDSTPEDEVRVEIRTSDLDVSETLGPAIEIAIDESETGLDKNKLKKALEFQPLLHGEVDTSGNHIIDLDKMTPWEQLAFCTKSPENTMVCEQLGISVEKLQKKVEEIHAEAYANSVVQRTSNKANYE